MSTRSDNTGEAKPLLPLELCTSIQSHICYMTLPPHCFISWKSVAGDTTGAQNSRRTKLDDSFMYSETKMKIMQYREDAVHYKERSEGQLHKKLVS